MTQTLGLKILYLYFILETCALFLFVLYRKLTSQPSASSQTVVYVAVITSIVLGSLVVAIGYYLPRFVVRRRWVDKKPARNDLILIYSLRGASYHILVAFGLANGFVGLAWTYIVPFFVVPFALLIWPFPSEHKVERLCDKP